METRCLSVVLDQQSTVYFPGQTVTGTVDYRADETLQLRGINLVAKGEARVHWSETRVQTTGQIKGQPETIHFTSEEHYFNQRIALLHNEGEMMELTAGSYQYPFSLKLPAALPSSFEGKYGRIRYTIKATVDRPGSCDLEAKVAISVNNVVDLNTIPLANESTKGSDSTAICCWCCTSPPISVVTWIGKMGYVPGQTVSFNGQVENLTGRTVLGSKLQLIQYTRYHAGGKTRIVERVLNEIQRGPFKGSETWDHVAIRIPPVPPSTLPKCDIIGVNYRLEVAAWRQLCPCSFQQDLGGQFTVRIGKFSSDLKVPLNIIIGSIPLRCFYQTFQSSSEASRLPKALRHHQHPDLPLPSFEESMFSCSIHEEGDSEHMNQGENDFAPRYLTYLPDNRQ